MRSLVAAFVWLCTAFSLPSTIAAQSRMPTVSEHQFQSCVKKAQSVGLGPQHTYVAWVSGIGHTCLQSDYPPAHARKSVIEFCERAVAPIRQQYKLKAPCKLVRDRGKVVDQAYGRSLKSEAPLPVLVQIFDAKTGKLHQAKGTYNQVVTRFRGPDPVESRFDIRAKGVSLCTGTTTFQLLSMNVRFEANCQNHAFRGSVSATKIVQSGGLFYIVPDQVRINTGESWVTMQF